MTKAERISIDLADDVAREIRAAVAGGEFASLDHAVNAALLDWKMRRLRDVERLRAMVDAGLASGSEPHDGMAAIRRDARRGERAS